MAVTRNADAVAPVRSSGPLSIWATSHVSTAIGALGRLARQPFASVMIILVIAVTLALPASINLLVKNARTVSGSWDNALDFAVFLQQQVSVDEAAALARLIEQRADVESVQFISADDALVEFKQQSGFGEALDQLPDNPLPHTLVVRPGPGNTSASLVLLQKHGDIERVVPATANGSRVLPQQIYRRGQRQRHGNHADNHDACERLSGQATQGADGGTDMARRPD